MNTTRSTRIWPRRYRAWLCAGLLSTLPWVAQADTPRLPVPPAPVVQPERLDYGLQPRQLAAGTWVIEGAVADFSRDNGCNIINTGFIVLTDGVVVINTGPSRLYGEQQRQAIARVTPLPIRQVIHLNLHPDYFLGNQAYANVPTRALAGSIAGMQAEGKSYEDNMFRLCGDWMKGTEFQAAREALSPGPLAGTDGRIELLRLDGHTRDDLVLIDRQTGVVFAGGLVFAERVPTTPHAQLDRWQMQLQALRQRLQTIPGVQVVPSHGPVHTGMAGLEQTLDWLQWLDQTLSQSAQKGLDLSEVLQLPIPTRFAQWAAQPAEFHRSVTYLYPRYELQALNAH